MQALVGLEDPFEQARRLKLLAGLEVTTKTVKRTAEAIGENIARGEQQKIQRAVQLDLPIVIGEPVPILYVPMDGTGVPVVDPARLRRMAGENRGTLALLPKNRLRRPQSPPDGRGTTH